MTATKSWVKLMSAILNPVGTDEVRIQVQDTGNVTRTLAVYNRADNFASGTVELLLAAGDGAGAAVTPTRDDFKLVNERLSAAAGDATRSGGNIEVTKQITNSTGSTVTIREIGLKMQLGDTGGIARTILMFHDSVAATAVANGSTFTVKYTVGWP